MYCKLFYFQLSFSCKYANIQPLAAYVYIFNKLSVYLCKMHLIQETIYLSKIHLIIPPPDISTTLNVFKCEFDSSRHFEALLSLSICQM